MDIKFRAWDEIHKCMVYQGELDLETLQSFMFHYGDKELMLFTGVYDKTGKEIYEYDICENSLGERGMVMFSNGYFYLAYFGEPALDYLHTFKKYDENFSNLLIIKNKFI